ncbi:MAG TPA: hypothetical protein VHB21_24430 [Minicystis sp.]|nr:hypothetical protein [Minicystis sp.]
MRRASWLLVLLVSALPAACQLVYGLDDFRARGGAGGAASGAGGSTSSSPPTGGSAPVCGRSGGGCVQGAPAGWTGYYHLTVGPPAQAPTECAAGVSPIRWYDGAPPSKCTPCECGAAPNVPCPPPSIVGFTFQGCNVKFGAIDDGSGDCLPTGQSPVRAGAPKPASCTPSGGELKVPTWSKELTLCAVAAGQDGCADGEACAPSDDPVCIVHDGIVDACPPGYGDPNPAYDTRVDTRACTGCTCDPDFTCPGGYEGYANDGNGTNVCNRAAVAIPPGICEEGLDFIQYVDAPPAGPLSCTPKGGVVSGAFTPGGPHTVCCATPPH